jgi:hypothetical protein
MLSLSSYILSLLLCLIIFVSNKICSLYLSHFFIVMFNNILFKLLYLQSTAKTDCERTQAMNREAKVGSTYVEIREAGPTFWD